ncbi:MAG: protein SCO1/2 [Oceanospirillaceae bacterium]|jgi:protein SCO1/2
MKLHQSKIIYVVVLTFALALGIVSYLSLNPSVADAPSRPKLGGDFSIPTADGVFNLQDYRNKVVVLYFGYASCPDVCPTALALLGNALKKLAPGSSAQIQPVFISLDPKRDTLEKLAVYGKYFYPSMISGTDEKKVIDKIVKQYGALYNYSSQDDSAMGYSVDHTSRLYLIDKQGILIDTIQHNDIQKDISQKMLKLTL